MMLKIMKRMRAFLALVIWPAAMVGALWPVVAAPASATAGLTAEQIIERLDANQYLSSVHMVSRLIINSGRRVLEKEMECWAIGSEKALVVFHNPADKGTKYLKLGNELWMYFPDAADLVKISGHMLRQGMMGSDISYQEALESEKLGELYRFELLGEEIYDGVKCFVLEARALPGKSVAYASRKIWVDAERFVGLKEELYAASGKLMKVSRVEELLRQGGRYYPKRVVMEDQLKKGSSTVLIVDSIEFNIKIPDEMFTLRSLMR